MKNHNTGQVVFCKEKMVNSEKEATADIMSLKSRMALNSPSMLKMLGYSTKIEKSLCSTQYVTKAFYDYPESDMKREQL